MKWNVKWQLDSPQCFHSGILVNIATHITLSRSAFMCFNYWNYYLIRNAGAFLSERNMWHHWVKVPTVKWLQCILQLLDGKTFELISIHPDAAFRLDSQFFISDWCITRKFKWISRIQAPNKGLLPMIR